MARAICKTNNKTYSITKHLVDNNGIQKWLVREESGRYDGITVSENTLKEMFDPKYGTLQKL
jgi:hypothetical protein